MKQILKRLISSIVFLAILFSCIAFVSDLLVERQNGTFAQDYYRYGKDTFDVIFIGPSTTQHGIQPMQLWEDQGIVSYNLGSAAQTIGEEYYLAKEAISRHHPKLIVADAGTIRSERKISSKEHLHMLADSMPFTSRTKWEMLLDLSGNDLLEFVFPLYMYHTRWKDLQKRDIAYDEKEQTMGANIYTGRNSGTPFIEKETDTSYELSGWSKYYTEKLIRLCRSTGTELLFITTPTLYQGTTVTQSVYDGRKGAAFALSKLLAGYGVTHLDYFTRGDELGIDRDMDSIDGHHLNFWGAKKYTAFLGNYISNRYNLTDHRSDPKYSPMEKALEEYKAYRWGKMLRISWSLRLYFDLLSQSYEDNDYMVVMAMAGSPADAFSASEAAMIMQSGTQQSLHHYGANTYIAVLDGGEVLYESDVRSLAQEEEKKITAGDITIEAMSSVPGQKSYIRINGEERASDSQGLQMVVLNKKTGQIEDAIVISTDSENHQIAHMN